MKTPRPLTPPRSRDSVWKQTVAGIAVAVIFLAGFGFEAWGARFFFPDHEPSMVILTVCVSGAVFGAMVAAPKLTLDYMREWREYLVAFLNRGR